MILASGTEKQDQVIVLLDLVLGHVVAKHDVWDDMDNLAGDTQLINNYLLQLIAVHNDLIGAMIAKICNHLRRLLRTSIAGVVPGIMNRNHQGISLQQWQGKVEPQMPMLKMDHIWIEVLDVPKNCIDCPHLLQRLTQSWLIEGLKVHGLIQLG
jgi:hypothetical protein